METQTEERIKLAAPTQTYKIMQGVGLALLIVGFAGPWVYLPLGKTTNWGWQPVWGFLLSLIEANIFILISISSCFSYVELYVRKGRPPLEALLKWIGGFFAMLIAVPFITWLFIDLRQASPTPLYAEGTFGWGVWVTLVGLIVQVVALRLYIRQVRQA